MIVVLDTNVLVSGLLKGYGHAGAIMRLLVRGTLQVALDARVLSEYREVLSREKFGFDLRAVEELLDQLRRDGLSVAAMPVPVPLPDPDDEPFLEVAIAASAILITGNKKHYAARLRQTAQVMSPAEFIEYFRQR